jgi:outer membrane protein
MTSTLLFLLTLQAAALEAAPSSAAPDTVRVTLAEALECARSASPRLSELRALEAAAEAAHRGAKADRLPTLALSASYTRNSNVPEFVVSQPSGELLTVFPNLPNQGWARADLTQPLYAGGRIAAGVTAALEQRKAAGYDTTAGQSDLTLEVASSFWRLVARRESERVLRDAIVSYEAHLVDTRNFVEVGMAARNDLLAVQVERDRAELARLEAQNAADTENANLVRLLDLPPATRVEPIEEGPRPAEEGGVEALVAEARERRAEIRALRARVAAAEAQVKFAHAAALPQASLQGRYDYANPSQRIFPLEGIWRDTWWVGVGVSITAFDGGRISAATARARAQADALSRQVQDLEQRVRLEVTTRLLDLRTARASLEVSARSIEAARENVKVSQDRYQAGVSPSSDLLDAETRLLRAGLDQTVATTDLHLALARLDHALGR